MDRNAPSLTVLCAAPVDPDLAIHLDRARALLPTLGGSMFALSPEIVEALAGRLRIGPVRRPRTGADCWGVWWHEDPKRYPVYLEVLGPADRADAVAWSMKHLDDYYDPETAQRGGTARWKELVGATRDVAEFNYYSGDRGGPGELVCWSLAGAILERTGGLAEDLGGHHAFDSGERSVPAPPESLVRSAPSAQFRRVTSSD